MTKHDIIQAEKVRSAKVWHDLCAAPIGEGLYESIIQGHLLEARADQIRDFVTLKEHNCVKGKEFGEWGVAPASCYGCQQEALATSLEAASKGV